jgi:hypothetical protein
MSDENDAAPEDCDLPKLGDDAEPDDAFDAFEQASEDFEPRPGRHVAGPDGLPIQLDETSLSNIPPLSPTTLVCMEDTSKLVLRDRWGEVLFETTPTDPEVERAPNGVWRIHTNHLLDRMRLALERFRKDYAELTREHRGDLTGGPQKDATPAQLLSAWLAPPGEFMDLDPMWTMLEPLRPACLHYVRVQTPEYNVELPRGTMPGIVRLCAARRNVEGAMMRIGNEGIYACSMRAPRDAVSEQNLDAFDRRKIREGEHRVYLPIKGDDSPPPEPGGIFGGDHE